MEERVKVEEVRRERETGEGAEREGGGQSGRRRVQEGILMGIADYLLQNPQDRKRVTVFVLVSLASYHARGRNLERLAQALEEDPLWASTLSALLLRDNSSLLPLKDGLEGRLRRAKYQLAERLVGAGGGMALASRILSLDPRLFIPLMVAQRTLEDKALVALAQAVAFGGAAVLRRYGLEALGK